jgi:transcriptional regulator with XRE-family HTH domain
MIKRCGEESVNFVENVRWLMEVRGISQRDLAQYLGTSPAYVSQVLTFKMFPSLARAEEIAFRFGVPLADFLGDQAAFQSRYARWSGRQKKRVS